MKNLIYAGVIGVCVLVAVVVFVKTRGGGTSGVNNLSDTEMTWVKCLKCGEGYEMSLKALLQPGQPRNPGPIPRPLPVTPPLTCQKCSKDGIVKAFKCEKCGEIFRAGSVPNDFEDRCPKCKHSATEAKREANKAEAAGVMIPHRGARPCRGYGSLRKPASRPRVGFYFVPHVSRVCVLMRSRRRFSGVRIL